jgi:hypothetical protein
MAILPGWNEENFPYCNGARGYARTRRSPLNRFKIVNWMRGLERANRVVPSTGLWKRPVSLRLVSAQPSGHQRHSGDTR